MSIREKIRRYRFFFAVLLACARFCALNAQTTHQLPENPSPGAAIQAASKASAQYHAHEGGVTILSNTQGVDFGPYIQKIRLKIQGNWFASIPNPSSLQKRGKAVVQFGILKDGKVIDLKTIESEGEVFDRPAIAAVASSNPFPPLPEAFQGKFLSLRMRFLYNPSPGDIGSAENSNSAVSDIRVQRGTLIQETADSHPIGYPEKAVRERTDGVVRLIARIAVDGTVESVATVDGNVVLGD